jgi:ParB/Sulfiredoxin domain
MQHSPTFQEIDIKFITLSDEWNLHPFLSSAPPSRLRHSIQVIGLLHPLILQKRPDNKYQLLCGRKRLRAFQEDRQTSGIINALILEEEIPPQILLHYILKDQMVAGTISPMETAYFFKYCLKYMDIEKAADSYFPVLEKKGQAHMINRILPLLDLEPEIQESIHWGKTEEKMALALQQLTPDDRLTLFAIFQEFELGGGKQKRFLALSKDLALRQDKTITALLAEPDFDLILGHPEMNRPQKASALLTLLQKKLAPESSAAEEAFQRAVYKMQLPTTYTISHSPAFERNEVYITLRFDSLTEIENRLHEIKALGTVKK